MTDFVSSDQPIRLKDVLNLIRYQALVAASSSATPVETLNDDIVVTPALLEHLIGHLKLKYPVWAREVPRIFVSHSHRDAKFCTHLVSALRDAGADVWYDAHNLDTGQLGPTIEHELRTRPIFIVVLSSAALQSTWVEDECRWAYNRRRHDPSRIILPVLAEAVGEEAIWMFLEDFKRIEAPGLAPYPPSEAVHRVLRALSLAPKGEAPETTDPQLGESVDDIIMRGLALQWQGRHTEALPLFQLATQLAPESFDAWADLGHTLNDLVRCAEAVSAFDQALAINPTNATIWNNKGWAHNTLGQYNDALVALDQALKLDPTYVTAWNNKGWALHQIGQYHGALAAYDEAVTCDPTYAIAWTNRGSTLFELELYEEALQALDRGLALDPGNTRAWRNKAIVLEILGRNAEAFVAMRRAQTQYHRQFCQVDLIGRRTIEL